MAVSGSRETGVPADALPWMLAEATKVRPHKDNSSNPNAHLLRCFAALLFDRGLATTARHPGTRGPVGEEALGLTAARVSEGSWRLDPESKGRRLSLSRSRVYGPVRGFHSRITPRTHLPQPYGGCGEGVTAGLPFLLVEELLLRPLPRRALHVPPASTHSPRFPICGAWRLRCNCVPRLLLLETHAGFLVSFSGHAACALLAP